MNTPHVHITLELVLSDNVMLIINLIISQPKMSGFNIIVNPHAFFKISTSGFSLGF